MSIRFLTAGESHGLALTVILDGVPAGLPLPVNVINHELKRRQTGAGGGPRMKKERDSARIIAGVMAGVTTGAPISLLIENKDHANWRGKSLPSLTIPRPGHADLSGAVKYGYRDLRLSLERASARETTARVGAGAICKHLLHQFGILIDGYVASIGAIEADLRPVPLKDRSRLAEMNAVHCPDQAAAQEMIDAIQDVMQRGDTLGGVIEIVVQGFPPGFGSFAQWDKRLDARLGAALLSVPAIKGVEIGPAFVNTRLAGTQVQDAIQLEDDRLFRPTNRAGGLEGGVTTGQPLLLRAAMKPIASTIASQPSVDLASGKQAPTNYERSDFCPVPRAIPILEAMVSITLADVLTEQLGGDSIADMLTRYAELRAARLPDLPMDSGAHIYWPEDGGENQA